MKNLWSDDAAAEIIDDLSVHSVNEDVALRVYTSRLIGAEPALVMHGGGNTSVKTRQHDFLNHECEVICVKGSGWDLATIEPKGLPAMHLAPLREIRDWDVLTDEEMVAFQRINLLDPQSPNPSVETLLHAFLPHKFIDHSHATAILALSDQPKGMVLCREIFGKRIAIVPYVMAGFQLAKATAAAFDENPGVEGILLHKHGLFTFGETARESYSRMIDFVSEAENAIEQRSAWSPKVRARPASSVSPGSLAPIIRGVCANELGAGEYQRFLSSFRASDQILQFVSGVALEEYGARGVVTPDHIIRTKNNYLISPDIETTDLENYKQALSKRVCDYRIRYDAYFAENNNKLASSKKKLDSSPRVVLVPNVGLFALGASASAATIAADLAELTIDTVIKAERVGTFEPLSDADLFEMEYWSLEQAKLGAGSPKALAGQIAIITGAGGAIGAATARLFAEQGAVVALFDIDEASLNTVAESIGVNARAFLCDVTDPRSVKRALDETCLTFGGVDILVSNAGAAFEAPIWALDDEILRKSFELNFFAHQTMAKGVVDIMKKQGTGGALLFNVSKQAVNPGENFGAYGLPKAASLFLVRQYALECGAFGIRANAVNADRIKSGLMNEDMIETRSKARGLTQAEYLQGNLLGREVLAEDVAQAFLHQTLALKTSGSITTVDGGNVAAMLR